MRIFAFYAWRNFTSSFYVARFLVCYCSKASQHLRDIEETMDGAAKCCQLIEWCLQPAAVYYASGYQELQRISWYSSYFYNDSWRKCSINLQCNRMHLRDAIMDAGIKRWLPSRGRRAPHFFHSNEMDILYIYGFEKVDYEKRLGSFQNTKDGPKPTERPKCLGEKFGVFFPHCRIHLFTKLALLGQDVIFQNLLLDHAMEF